MTRKRPRPILCALMCAAFVLAIMLLSGCASGPVAWPHFTTPAGSNWQQACDPDCDA